MSWSKDKTICWTQTPQSCFSSPVPQHFFNHHEYEKISHICTKKSEDTILYKAPFCLFFPFFFYKYNSRHVTQMCVMISMGELWERERGGVTLKPESENSQETKVPGPRDEPPTCAARLHFPSRGFEDVSPAVLVLKRVTMYQQRSSNSVTILPGLQYTDSVVTKPIQLYTRTTSKQEHLDQYIWTDIKEKVPKIRKDTAPQDCVENTEWHIVCNCFSIFIKKCDV